MLHKIQLLAFFLLLVIPNQALAYSDYIIASGDNIGIKLQTQGIIVVGTYDINGVDPATEAGLKAGDIITTINHKNVNSIDEINNIISNNNDNVITVGYIRDNNKFQTVLHLKNNKTGLYLKDTISGIGTLTFIDPETKTFGALGHEIVNSATGEVAKVFSGNIFTSSITSITPSNNGVPGEKNAALNSKDVIGKIYENTNKGVFGSYHGDMNDNSLYRVANPDKIEIGKAKIRTVLSDNEIEEYDIKILSLKETKDNTKNIVFEITDDELLSKTGGIVQGMSGSPIIQGDYIIGAVTHVVVQDPTKGYGIFITNMLEEAES